MGFIRVKQISGARYAYEVENYWTPKGSRQRTKQYLGRTYTPALLRAVSVEISDIRDLCALIIMLAQTTLIAHGFETEGSDLVWKHIRINLKRSTFLAHNKPAVIELNEGFLCQQTYKALKDYTPSIPRFEKELATRLLAAGLLIEPDQFIHLFEAAKKRFKTLEHATEQQ